jgi:hypothetical protein
MRHYTVEELARHSYFMCEGSRDAADSNKSIAFDPVVVDGLHICSECYEICGAIMYLDNTMPTNRDHRDEFNVDGTVMCHRCRMYTAMHILVLGGYGVGDGLHLPGLDGVTFDWKGYSYNDSIVVVKSRNVERSGGGVTPLPILL